MKEKYKKLYQKILYSGWGVWFFSLVWFLLRTGTKPARAVYPCQQAARTNIFAFGFPLVVLFWSRFKKCKRFQLRVLSLILIALFLTASVFGLIRTKAELFSRYWRFRELPGKESRALAAFNSRVVWITDNNSTSGWSGDSARVNSEPVLRMADEAIKALTGRNSVKDAWTGIFQNHNGGRDYSPGEKIAIKVNFNNSSGSGSGNNCLTSHCPTYQVINALLRQLIQEKGIIQGNIIIYDISRTFPDYYKNGIRTVYPNVLLNPDTATVSENVRGARFARVLAEANYLINMPLLRNHSLAGATLSFKNHLGSTSGSSAFHGAFFNTSPSSNSLVQLNSHPFIKDKTILVVADALYGLKNGGPFGNPDGSSGIKPYPNSLFLSTDPVAADSVMVDYLESKNSNIQSNGDPRTYLQAAAQIGLGVFTTSCSSGNCSFNYGNIDLVRCNPNCPGTSPPSGSSPAFSPAASPALTSVSAPACGGPADVDCDNNVDKDDVLMVLRNYGRNPSQVSGYHDPIGDNKINGLDFARIKGELR